MRRAVPDRMRLGGGASLLFVLGLCVAGGPALGAAGGAGPRSQPAKVDTVWTGPDEEPRPTVAYGSFAVARDSLEALLRRVLGAYADSATWSREKTRFVYRDTIKLSESGSGNPIWSTEDRDSAVTVPCLSMRLSTPGVDTHDAIEEALGAAGWAREDEYGADGADGTNFAFVSPEALCVVSASWGGGDLEDTTSVASSEYIELQCVPRPPIRPDRRRHR